jgi:hypothetical protein
MKGIYLTQEGKQEIEDEIKNLEDRAYNSGVNTDHYFNCFSKKEILEEILESATILPVETVDNVFRTGDDDVNHYIENVACLPSKYLNGVIIQPKQ